MALSPKTSPAALAHEWTFVPTARETGPRVTAICTACGLLRSAVAPTADHEGRIDLRGSCPGEPQAPDARPSPTLG